MDRTEIVLLGKEYNNLENIEEIKNNLEKKYEISYGKYSEIELKKALSEKKPVIIKNNFLIGYDEKNFINFKEEKITIDKMVKALIIEEQKTEENSSNYGRDPFVIIGKNLWPDISDFLSIFNTLYVGEIHLPPHSAIFNFLEQSDEFKKKKIVSMLEGVNINLYDKENYIDNAMHEIGHLFWRDCVNFNEKKAFKNFFKTLKPSSIYEYKWERETEEEVFCTIYKWFMKSFLINKSFYNILEFEEPEGLLLLQGILNRISREKQISDIWNLSKHEVFDYLNPKFDMTTGKYLRKAGSFDKIKDIEIPVEILNNIECFKDGIEFINLEKAIVPVKENKIDWENLEKARRNKLNG